MATRRQSRSVSLAPAIVWKIKPGPHFNLAGGFSILVSATFFHYPRVSPQLTLSHFRPHTTF